MKPMVYYRVGNRPRLHDTLASAEATSVLWWLNGGDVEDCIIRAVRPCCICGVLDCAKTHLLSEVFAGREDLP